jgi:hypothetical protein
VLRTIANSLLSLLVLATFMWGGCVSCAQYFMFPGKQLRSCCNNSGQCERPAKTPRKQKSRIVTACLSAPAGVLIKSTRRPQCQS